MINISEYPVIFEQNVAWGDMDAFGHVNNVQYYRYIESARICYFEELNIFQQDIYTVVASSQCQYLRPLFYPDQLKIGARVEECRVDLAGVFDMLLGQNRSARGNAANHSEAFLFNSVRLETWDANAS